MQLKMSRNGKDLRTNNVVSFLSQRRDLLDEAYPGDVIGIPNHGVLQLGDTLTEGEPLQFTGLPFFRAGNFLCRGARRSHPQQAIEEPALRSSAKKARSRSSGRMRAARCCSAR